MALLLTLPLSGCAGTPAQSPAPGSSQAEPSAAPSIQTPETVSFTDGLGRELEIARPRRAAALEESLLNNPAWAGLRAVRENRFHVLDHTLYNVKPNVRWGEAYEKLANILYPAE